MPKSMRTAKSFDVLNKQTFGMGAQRSKQFLPDTNVFSPDFFQGMSYFFQFPSNDSYKFSPLC